jgi:hypothetical protein
VRAKFFVLQENLSVSKSHPSCVAKIPVAAVATFEDKRLAYVSLRPLAVTNLNTHITRNVAAKTRQVRSVLNNRVSFHRRRDCKLFLRDKRIRASDWARRRRTAAEAAAAAAVVAAAAAAAATTAATSVGDNDTSSVSTTVAGSNVVQAPRSDTETKTKGLKQPSLLAGGELFLVLYST